MILEKYGLADYMEKRFHSDEIGAYKPIGEFFEKVVGYSDPRTKSCTWGIPGRTSEAGLYAILINPNAKEYRKVEARGYEVMGVKEALEMLWA